VCAALLLQFLAALLDFLLDLSWGGFYADLRGLRNALAVPREVSKLAVLRLHSKVDELSGFLLSYPGQVYARSLI
jgi:hypothetical protein